MADTSNDAAASAHILDFQVVGLVAAQRKVVYDESYKRMDEWLDGRRDVVLDGDRRPRGGPARRRYQQAIQK